MKLGVVVQRYGRTVNGGAEVHARYIAEHLARHADVEVLTTCATDYVTWRNELKAGPDLVNGVPVRRFPVSRERDTAEFSRRSHQVFTTEHSLADELAWLDAEGPMSPALIRHIARHAGEYDYFFFFSCRYYQSYHGARAAASRAILVPTAEREASIGLSIFQPIFRGVRALMYNSPEERAMIEAVAGTQRVPSVVVGVGTMVPPSPQPGRFRQKFNIRGPFAVYVGRIDENKGCRELFGFFDAYLRADSTTLSLVLVGDSLLPIPQHPRFRHLGFLDDADKFDAMAAAELLIMPSYFESLSMVTLEAWALGRPVLANAKCDVLKGQAIRSNAALYYDDRTEFIETLRALEQNRWLSATLGRNGRQFYRDNYDWPVIERKYLEMISRLSSLDAARADPQRAEGSKKPAGGGIEPLPGWFGRRRPDCPPSAQVVATLPTGAAHGETGAPARLAIVPAPQAPAERVQTFRNRRDSRPLHGSGRRPGGRA